MARYYELYKILILACTLAGVYFPSIEKIYGTKWYIKLLKRLFILPGIFLPLYLASSIKYQIFDDDELGNKIYGYMIIVYCFFTTFTIYSFYYFRNDFEKVFELWDSMFQDELFPEDREELLAKNRRVTNGWLKIFGGLNILGCVTYFAVTYANPDKKLAHPSGIPYKYQSPDFELVNTLDLINCTFGFASKTKSRGRNEEGWKINKSQKKLTAENEDKSKRLTDAGLKIFKQNEKYLKKPKFEKLLTSDAMMMVFLSLEEAQLKHLKNSFAKILGTLSLSDSGKPQIGTVEVCDVHSHEMKAAIKETEKNIRIWISHHLQILRFHKELQRIYSVLLSVKFFVIIMIICLICFLGLTGKLRLVDMFLAFVFCSNNYALFYVNVMFADSILEAGETLFEEAFEKSWYLYPKRLRTSFHIIIMRSHGLIQYRAFKIYPLSSKSFLKILSSAYSFFTFMLQINRKKDE